MAVASASPITIAMTDDVIYSEREQKAITNHRLTVQTESFVHRRK
jgi:hypothetical protein